MADKAHRLTDEKPEEMGSGYLPFVPPLLMATTQQCGHLHKKLNALKNKKRRD